ncbi:hypothetical protein MUP35_01900 [Patescibacteria group bacterium]|nr:hypothetical protein [Patescibacteria group bacterium]
MPKQTEFDKAQIKFLKLQLYKIMSNYPLTKDEREALDYALNNHLRFD